MVVLNLKLKYYSLILFSASFLFSNDISIDVITTNDLHGYINENKAYFINPNFPATMIGGSGFYKYVKDIEYKLENNAQDMLILDGGNFFQGSPIGVVDSGKTMIEWMNKIKYDAYVPGHYDFIFGYNNLIDLSKLADFPFLAANLLDDKGKTIFDPYMITSIKSVKIGIIGIVNDEIDDLVLEENLNGINVKSALETLDIWIPKMKDDDVDIIIVLTSLGVPYQREDVYAQLLENPKDPYKEHLNAIELGYYLNDVDFIVSGGRSKGYDNAWYDPNSHIYVFQNYGNGTEFGHFKIICDEKSKLFKGYESAVKNSVSQSLFFDDFDYDIEQYNWIKEKFIQANIKMNKSTDWDKKISLPSNGQYSQNYNNWDIPSIDKDNSIEIITWNCEFFPANDDSTISALSEAVNDLSPDIVAFQEIIKKGWFSKLMKLLPDYNYVMSMNSSFMSLPIIYKKDLFDLVNYKELFIGNTYFFAGRNPLQCDLIYKDQNLKLSLINLHMKCCDLGLQRRKIASQMLHDYINNEINNGENHNFIVLGDWNDDLKDYPGQHCFDPFLNDNRFFFPTQDIVYDISQASYPKEPYVSFLDHILVSESLTNKNSYNINTIPIDSYMGGYSIYEKYISDHMPVLLSMQIPKNVIVPDVPNIDNQIIYIKKDNIDYINDGIKTPKYDKFSKHLFGVSSIFKSQKVYYYIPDFLDQSMFWY